MTVATRMPERPAPQVTAATPTLYLVAPPSLRSWFEHFTDERPGDGVLYIGEEPRFDLLPVMRATDRGRRALRVMVISSHETLERDVRVTEALRALGVDVVGPSATSVQAGVDKQAMKRFFDRHGFATPPWQPGPCVTRLGEPDDLVVVKRRRSTQSEGMRLQPIGAAAPGPDEVCERYVDGVEYSVVVYRDEHRELVFPPIWKGRTSHLLVPPWKRLRLCPDPMLSADCDRRLRASARSIAQACDLCGHLEVEYLVTAGGSVQVLEINPRVAGTMRLAALATRTPLFSLHRHSPVRADLQASAFAAEVPYRGPAYSDPAAGVFATSRLTVAGSSLAVVRAKLELALRRARPLPAAATRRRRPPSRPLPAGAPVAVGA